MVAVSDSYLAGLLLIPAVIGFFVGRLYWRRGWPRGDIPVWRRLLRSSLGIVIGLYIVLQVAGFVAQNSPAPPPSAMDKWVTNVFKPVGATVTRNLDALKAAEAAKSIGRMNDACLNGEAAIDSSWTTKPKPPNVAFRPYYKTWAVAVYSAFDYCFQATKSPAFFDSAAGVKDWALLRDYANQADRARSAMISEGKKLGG